ncbi:MAG TPA: hypothetical protein VLY63_05510 [Anaerolineae bacterium]|nr:hypothetical protein [Anaerolineae bacterium]
MKRSMGLFIVVLSIALSACAPKAIPASVVAGTYRTTLTVEALRSAGMSGVTAAPFDNTTYQVKFSSDGSLEMWQVNAIGTTPIMQAQFTLTSETVTIKNPSGSLGERCADKGDGTYAWTLDGDRLTLTSVKDNCEFRRQLIDALPWNREQ